MIYQTRSGKSVESDKPINEIVAIVRTINNTFAQSLIRQYDSQRGLSLEQKNWLYVIGVEHERKLASPPPVSALGSIQPILDLFKAAVGRLKYPKITLATATGRPVCLSVCGAKSKTPGAINVTDGGRYGQNVYYGRIDVNGNFTQSSRCDQDILDLLVELAADPAGTAAKYGRMTGHCCFCRLALTDERSVAVGYGPVCADAWDLPWGKNAAMESR